MSTATHIAPIIASVNAVEPTTQKIRLRSYPEIANYILKKFVDDQTLTKMGAPIHRFTQRVNMTPMQYTDCMYAESCKVADVYEEATLNDNFIEGADFSICHSLRQYCSTQPHADETDISSKAQLLLAIQTESVKLASSGKPATKLKFFA